MALYSKAQETVQHYHVRFPCLMQRTNISDNDDTFVPIFIKGLDKSLKYMVNISRGTELTEAT